MALPSKFEFSVCDNAGYTAEKLENGDYLISKAGSGHSSNWAETEMESPIGDGMWKITKTFPEPLPDKFVITVNGGNQKYTVLKEQDGYSANWDNKKVEYRSDAARRFIDEGIWVVVDEAAAPVGIQEHNGIKIGDRVVIVSTGQHYPSFRDWAAENNLTKHLGDGRGPNAGDVLTVVAIAPHGRGRGKDTVLFGLENQSGQYIWGAAGVKLAPPEVPANGFGADGKPLHFTEDMLQIFQRVLLRSGKVRIAVPSAQKDEGAAWALVYNGGWDSFCAQDTKYPEYDAVAVYASPEFNYQLLDPSVKGALLWKAEDTAGKQARAEELQRQLVAAADAVATATERMEAIKEELQAI